VAVVKRSVSVDAAVWAAATVEAGTASVSSLVNDALVHYLSRQRGLAAISAYEDEFGPFTDEELSEADRLLDAAGVVDLASKP
jgi:hypothetical protein